MSVLSQKEGGPVSEMAEADLAMIDVLRRVIDGASVLTVFGAPVTQDGVTVIPVARVPGAGGAGGGGGPGPQGREAGGTGGGFTLSARPAGVFVVRGGKVSWRPALDVNERMDATSPMRFDVFK